VTDVIRAASNTRIDASQFIVGERSEAGTAVGPPPNGLISVGHGIAAIIVGTSTGVVTVEVELHRDRPTVADIDRWDEIIEVDLEAPVGDVAVMALMADPPDLPVLTPSGPGRYRLRVHAAHRDDDYDIVTYEPVERYLIQSWPATEPQEETVHKQTDRVGALYRRQQAGQARNASGPRPGRPSRGRPPTTWPRQQQIE
jgi:hypothetical protein